MSRTKAVLPAIGVLLIIAIVFWTIDETAFHPVWIVTGIFAGFLLVTTFLLGKTLNRKYLCDISIIAILVLIGFTFFLRRILFGYYGFLLGFLITIFIALVGISVYKRRIVDWSDLANVQ